jgi:hypothetical protein
MAAISISWADLAKVAEVSLAFGVGIITVFALGSLGISRIATARERGGSRAGGYVAAGAAFAACAAATLYGLYLLIPQFHN